MTTISQSSSGRVAAEFEPLFPTLAKFFSPGQQHELLKEDFVAGRNVASILIAVVGAAMLAGLATVLGIVLIGS